MREREPFPKRTWLPQLLIYSILEYTENKFQNVNPYYFENQTYQLVFSICSQLFYLQCECIHSKCCVLKLHGLLHFSSFSIIYYSFEIQIDLFFCLYSTLLLFLPPMLIFFNLILCMSNIIIIPKVKVIQKLHSQKCHSSIPNTSIPFPLIYYK